MAEERFIHLKGRHLPDTDLVLDEEPRELRPSQHPNAKRLVASKVKLSRPGEAVGGDEDSVVGTGATDNSSKLIKHPNSNLLANKLHNRLDVEESEAIISGELVPTKVGFLLALPATHKLNVLVSKTIQKLPNKQHLHME